MVLSSGFLVLLFSQFKTDGNKIYNLQYLMVYFISRFYCSYLRPFLSSSAKEPRLQVRFLNELFYSPQNGCLIVQSMAKTRVAYCFVIIAMLLSLAVTHDGRLTIYYKLTYRSYRVARNFCYFSSDPQINIILRQIVFPQKFTPEYSWLLISRTSR